jgi:hypothetical protein
MVSGRDVIDPSTGLGYAPPALNGCVVHP